MMVLRASQVAEAAGVNRQTLRYYERLGLLQEPDRSPGGHRLYSDQTVTVLRVIKAAQRLGFTLAEVAELLDLGAHVHRPARRSAGLQQRARDKLGEIEGKIADLTVIAETLGAAQVAGCDDLLDCATDPHCPLPFGDLADRPSQSPANPVSF